jgi:hypothetical protein
LHSSKIPEAFQWAFLYNSRSYPAPFQHRSSAVSVKLQQRSSCTEVSMVFP